MMGNEPLEAHPSTSALPVWALDVTRQLAVLTTTIGAHITLTERTLGDIELRLRVVEARRTEELPEDVADHESRLRNIEIEQNRNSWLPRIAFALTTALLGAAAALLIH